MDKNCKKFSQVWYAVGLMSKKRARSPWIILFAIALAAVVGYFITPDTRLLGISLYRVLDIGGTLFINALTLVVVPLVSSSIITGVARIASEAQFGRIGSLTFGYFALTNAIGIAVGFFFVQLFGPGLTVSSSFGSILNPNSLALAQDGLFTNLILEIIPPNILAAFAKGNMLGLIFFSLIFGYAITQISKKLIPVHLQIWKGVFEAMLQITHGIMYLLPLGVFCLTAKIFAESGLETLLPLGNLLWAVLVAFAVFGLGILPLFLTVIGKVSISNYFRAISPAVVTAFSTSSSSATLPISLECMEERAGISNRICSLVIPLGSSLNLSGTALYNTMVTFFIAQAFGIDLPLAKQILLLVSAFLISFGVASIPGGGLVAILSLLRIAGLPIEGIGLVVAIDRILDMMRTIVNLLSYTTCVTLVAVGDGEKRVLTKKLHSI